MNEKNEYDDHNNTLPLNVKEFTLTHWTDRVSVHFQEIGSYCLAIRFDKLSTPAVESIMGRVLRLYKTTIYQITFNKAARVATVNYKGEMGHAWMVFEHVESVYNDRW